LNKIKRYFPGDVSYSTNKGDDLSLAYVYLKPMRYAPESQYKKQYTK